jgi:hypothetical protein
MVTLLFKWALGTVSTVLDGKVHERNFAQALTGSGRELHKLNQQLRLRKASLNRDTHKARRYTDQLPETGTSPAPRGAAAQHLLTQLAVASQNSQKQHRGQPHKRNESKGTHSSRQVTHSVLPTPRRCLGSAPRTQGFSKCCPGTHV